MKAAIAVVLFCILASFAVAQTQVSNLYAAGVSYNNSGSPTVAGTGLYAHAITDGSGTYAFTVVDALPQSVKPFTVNTNFGAGIAQKAFSIGSVPVFVPTAAGISYNGSAVGWQWNTGLLTSIPLKGKLANWRVLPSIRVLKSSVGTGYQPIFGIMFGYAK